MGIFYFLKPLFEQTKAPEPPLSTQEKKTTSLSQNKNTSLKFTLSSKERTYDRHMLSEGIPLGDILLLYKSDGKPENDYVPSYLLYDYNINATDEYDNLLGKGYLRWGTPKENLDILKVTDLKNILKFHQLPMTGRKQDLINRICDNLSEDEVSTFATDRCYKITESGSALLDKYKNVIWGHRNSSQDGIVNAFSFENRLSEDPVQVAVELLENSIPAEIQKGHFDIASSRYEQMSNYKDGDVLPLMQSFCLQISGLGNYSGELLECPEYWRGISTPMKSSIALDRLTDTDIENAFREAWRKTYPLFPISVVNNEQDALNLLFFALNNKKKDFDALMKALYKKVPKEYRMDDIMDEFT